MTNPGKSADEQHAQESEQLLHRITVLQGVFSAFLVLFTLAQVIVGYWQWSAMSDQYSAMQLDQRPWLSFETPLMDPPVVGEHLEGAINIRNAGKTPGTIIGEDLAISLQPANFDVAESEHGRKAAPILKLDLERLLDDLRGIANSMHTETVIPQGGSNDYWVSTKNPLSPDDVRALVAGEKIAVIVTYMEYLDSVGKKHATWACFWYDAKAGRCTRHTKYNHMD